LKDKAKEELPIPNSFKKFANKQAAAEGTPNPMKRLAEEDDEDDEKEEPVTKFQAKRSTEFARFSRRMGIC